MADEKQPMYPRTVWVHALRRWLDGEIGPDGEQLTIPGMPEPPERASQRMWFLVIHDYARPDGYMVAPRDQLERRWHIPPRTAEKYWQLTRRLGWTRLVGGTNPGRSQVRQLTVPDWAVKPEKTPRDTAAMGTPPGVTILGMGTPQGVNGYAPTGPPEVDRSEVELEVNGAASPAQPAEARQRPEKPAANAPLGALTEDERKEYDRAVGRRWSKPTYTDIRPVPTLEELTAAVAAALAEKGSHA